MAALSSPRTHPLITPQTLAKPCPSAPTDQAPCSASLARGGGSRGQFGILGGGPCPRRCCLPPALPIHKGRLCPGNTAHLGLGGRGCCEHSATVKAGQTRLCPPWPRCLMKRGPAVVLMGLLPALPKPAPRLLIPAPPNACFRSRPGTPPPVPGPPPRPWPQLCPTLTNIPLSLLSLWLFRVPSLHVVGNRDAGPQSRGQAWGGGGLEAWPSHERGDWNPASGR